MYPAILTFRSFQLFTHRPDQQNIGTSSPNDFEAVFGRTATARGSSPCSVGRHRRRRREGTAMSTANMLIIMGILFISDNFFMFWHLLHFLTLVIFDNLIIVDDRIIVDNDRRRRRSTTTRMAETGHRTGLCIGQRWVAIVASYEC